jgi:hypothetical protein
MACSRWPALPAEDDLDAPDHPFKRIGGLGKGN